MGQGYRTRTKASPQPQRFPARAPRLSPLIGQRHISHQRVPGKTETKPQTAPPRPPRHLVRQAQAAHRPGRAGGQDAPSCLDAHTHPLTGSACAQRSQGAECQVRCTLKRALHLGHPLSRFSRPFAAIVVQTSTPSSIRQSNRLQPAPSAILPSRHPRILPIRVLPTLKFHEFGVIGKNRCHMIARFVL